MADQELAAAIAAAADEIRGETSEAGKPGEVELSEEETGSEEETTDEETESSDLTDAEIDEARRLYKALRDPKAGPALVAALAQQNGLLNQPIETKKEQAEVKKDILSIFKEELGESYAFLAERLGKAVDKSLDSFREEQQAAVAELQVANLKTEVDKTLSSLAKETNGASRKLESKMAELMNEYPIGQKANVDKYIRDMYGLASSGTTKKTVEKQVSDKIRRNANNVADRLSTKTSAAPSTDSLPAKKMGLKESVEWAVEQMKNKK